MQADWSSSVRYRTLIWTSEAIEEDTWCSWGLTWLDWFNDGSQMGDALRLACLLSELDLGCSQLKSKEGTHHYFIDPGMHWCHSWTCMFPDFQVGWNESFKPCCYSHKYFGYCSRSFCARGEGNTGIQQSAFTLQIVDGCVSFAGMAFMSKCCTILGNQHAETLTQCCKF